MISCTRRVQFCAGHRVLGHEGKCSNIHGHNYVALIHARTNWGVEKDLDEIGRVIDFSVLKEKIGGWIERNWDHKMIAFKDDDAIWNRWSVREFGEIWESPVNPTAENLADFLLDVVCPPLLNGSGVEVFKIELWETENCHATAEL